MDTKDIKPPKIQKPTAEIKKPALSNEEKVIPVETTDAAMLQGTENTLDGQKKILKQAIPLLLLILVNFIYQKTIYIILFLSLFLVFDRANDFVVKQHILQNRRCVKKTFILFVFLVFNVILLTPISKDFWLLNLSNLNNWFKTNLDFWGILFSIAVFDFLFKLSTICMKCLILFPTFKLLQPSKRGGLFEVIESSSQFIRCILPIPEWIKYCFGTSSTTLPLLFSWLFVIFYIIFKITSLKSKIPYILKSFSTVKNPQVIGTPILSENIPNGKSICPVCHQRFTEPMQLPCEHVFCHGCCQLWFDRDVSCPVCSAHGLASLVMGQSSRLPSSIPLLSKNSPWRTGTSEFIVQLF